MILPEQKGAGWAGQSVDKIPGKSHKSRIKVSVKEGGKFVRKRPEALYLKKKEPSLYGKAPFSIGVRLDQRSQPLQFAHNVHFLDHFFIYVVFGAVCFDDAAIFIEFNAVFDYFFHILFENS